MSEKVYKTELLHYAIEKSGLKTERVASISGLSPWMVEMTLQGKLVNNVLVASMLSAVIKHLMAQNKYTLQELSRKALLSEIASRQIVNGMSKEWDLYKKCIDAVAEKNKKTVRVAEQPKPQVPVPTTEKTVLQLRNPIADIRAEEPKQKPKRKKRKGGWLVSKDGEPWCDVGFDHEKKKEQKAPKQKKAKYKPHPTDKNQLRKLALKKLKEQRASKKKVLGDWARLAYKELLEKRSDWLISEDFVEKIVWLSTPEELELCQEAEDVEKALIDLAYKKQAFYIQVEERQRGKKHKIVLKPKAKRTPAMSAPKGYSYYPKGRWKGKRTSSLSDESERMPRGSRKSSQRTTKNFHIILVPRMG